MLFPTSTFLFLSYALWLLVLENVKLSLFLPRKQGGGGIIRMNSRLRRLLFESTDAQNIWVLPSKNLQGNHRRETGTIVSTTQTRSEEHEINVGCNGRKYHKMNDTQVGSFLIACFRDKMVSGRRGFRAEKRLQGIYENDKAPRGWGGGRKWGDSGKHRVGEIERHG